MWKCAAINYLNLSILFIVATNGFLDTGDDPGYATDYSNECPLPNTSLLGDLFFVLHDDIVISNSVFHKYFAACPRPPDVFVQDGCHVFHWNPAKHYPEEFSNRGFDIEAILYDKGDVVYQYTDLSKEDGGNIEEGYSATIGVRSS